MKARKIISLAIFSLFVFSSCDILFPEAGSGTNGTHTVSGGGGNNTNTIPVVYPTSDPAKKRGICYNHLNEAEVKVLANSNVSWVYNWGRQPSAQEDALFEQYGIEFYPMQWGLSTEESRKELCDYYTKHPDCKYLLGYNEPNLKTAGDGGSEITPAAAAEDWPNLEKIAEDFNLYLVGPALQYSGATLSDGVKYDTPKKWMDAFISEYKKLHDNKEPRYDYFSLHCYMNWPGAQSGYLREYYDGVSAYNKKIWLTEFCAWEYNNGGQNESMAAQMSSMVEKVQFMDGYDGCEKYAWFMSHGEADKIPFNSLFNGDGSLTALGKSYLGVKPNTLLTVALEEAKNLLDTAQQGEDPGQYPKSAIDDLQSAYDSAKEKENSTVSAELNSAYEALSAAINKFKSEVVPQAKRDKTALTADSFNTSLTNGLNVSAFTASSVKDTSAADKAFDKDVTNTRWESEHGKDPQWLCIDFGSEKEFNTIKFFWEGAYAKTFRIEISNDNTNWTSILDVDNGTGGSETYKLTKEYKARYVRFFGTERALDYGYSFYEMGIFKE